MFAKIQSATKTRMFYVKSLAILYLNTSICFTFQLSILLISEVKKEKHIP